ncbi:MAG: hypothetical protein ACR5LD_06130 [Symbiopectobacterium sp.]
MPLHIFLRKDLDCGESTIASKPDSKFTSLHLELAGRMMAAQLYWQDTVIPTDISFRAV